ncbi:UDP-N-acetylmuramoyl-L-alanyl-D-glutamate--2,6-diaminopimelate ligase [Candidatus Kinetoplastidibacterium crithidiae]|uniref:Multifunctional fusion protein n=1 Tax=Candidatus Kinetoplastidibacterium crithidiae TCC036E TaxID=1208918 RepID=M1LUT1_9PROT|nr:UDP-N-acetylmuramoyl-L-alanyl-D-glutamate--2,6-diaminopimelate ligase [Candidatus Kinetoplastibacterium crithidii]AGF47856.1 bifunctional UDP-N-acetylmuramoylalanyl-D-glutamate--2,6-diaminopimelate ligase/UDP-N-acetylmuramyl pentapeptide synthase MurE/MurF [Candidatus Kinetoplastibacterium crithidii TCC036E]
MAKKNTPNYARLIPDSRKILHGDVFVLNGVSNQNDLSLYIAEAINKKASAIVIEKNFEVSNELIKQNNIKCLKVHNLGAILGYLADKWYGQPSSKIEIIAITGTNGKTTCANWIAQSLNNHGRKCGVIGTIGAILPDGRVIYRGLTTPDILMMHWIIFEMYMDGVEFIVMEASSIGIDQGRLNSLKLKIACFTNLTRDHLDYHKNLNAYQLAKSKLFSFESLSNIVINIDDFFGREILKQTPRSLQITFGLDHQLDPNISAYDISKTEKGYSFRIAIFDYFSNVVFGVIGEHNISNVLLVVGVLKTIGMANKDIIHAIEKLKNVYGRMEVVEPLLGFRHNNMATVVIDYAHTPDALEKTLISLKEKSILKQGKLICVFGCGGDRDQGKRKDMTKIALSISDKVVITSDNPRSEDPEVIISQMLEGNDYSDNVFVISKRSRAILYAIWNSDYRDIVLIAGKGHEKYQDGIYGKIFFDDTQWSQLAMILPNASGVSIDSRSLEKGNLFFALKGPNFNGHDYLDSAYRKGACAAIVSHDLQHPSEKIPQILVDNTYDALIDTSFSWRRKCHISSIAVVGSNGKTTTKEMISLILSSFLGNDYCHHTKGNLNNHIGVPLTILGLKENHKVGVFELGMNHPGEINILSEIVKPNIAVITNAQREHQEFMKDVNSVAYENGSVINFIAEDGFVIYPGDDICTKIWDELSIGKKVLRFGLNKDCNVYAKDVFLSKEKTSCIVVFNAEISSPLTLNIPGIHNLKNALAAITVALAFGIPFFKAIKYISCFQSLKGRMCFHRLDNGVILIDDTYNSNPDSAIAAIDVLKKLQKPQILVFGDMGEVGSDGNSMHHEIGKYAYENGIDSLIAIGDFSNVLLESFGANSLVCKDIEEIIEIINKISGPASVLVKGSRFMKMERIISHFENNNL